jgi:hypothetical protein
MMTTLTWTKSTTGYEARTSSHHYEAIRAKSGKFWLQIDGGGQVFNQTTLARCKEQAAEATVMLEQPAPYGWDSTATPEPRAEEAERQAYGRAPGNEELGLLGPVEYARQHRTEPVIRLSGLEVYGDAVYATSQGIRIGRTGSFVPASTVYGYLDKAQARRLRKALHAAGFGSQAAAPRIKPAAA